MSLRQPLGGLIEPSGPGWDAAPPSLRRAFYDAAGAVVLQRLAIQLSRVVGANGRAMIPRKQAVLPDGADGPVMEPHYDASRVITLADYTATDHGLTLWWQAGTGHRSHRTARGKGQKPTPFGDVLQYHADGMVPHAPARDVRLSKASIRQVRIAMAAWWESHKPKIAKVLGGTPRLAPTGASISDRRARGFTAPPLPKPLPRPVPVRPRPIVPGVHPTPTHPIPIVPSLPRGRIKGPTFVITGAQPKPPAAPKSPTPTPAPTPQPAPPAPAAPPKPRTPLDRAVAYLQSRGIAVEPAGHAHIEAKHGAKKAADIPAAYRWKEKTIYLNEDHAYWRDPKAYMATVGGTGFASTDRPSHVLVHEVGHAMHHAATGDVRYNATRKVPLAAAEEHLIRSEVSTYGRKNPLEFVAEVYAGTFAGKQYSPAVMALYRRFGGPTP